MQLIECTPFERTGPPQNGIQSTQQQQAAASVINSGANMQQPSASQQPIQFQNIAGPGQVSFNGNPPPLYYGGNPYPNQGYFQDPTKMAYATLPMQPYPTSSMPPQLYGGNYFTTPQQVRAIPPIHVGSINYIHVLFLMCSILAGHGDPTTTNLSPN